MDGNGLAIRASGLVKSYGQRRALDGLDLEVPRGVVYGFLGPNGAGKTTTMRILTGLIKAEQGSMELLGRPFTGHERTRLFEVGALIETPSFYPYMSGRDNLRVVAGSGPPVTASRVEEVLELVDLRERGDDRYVTYSLGMKQRLGIAATLLNDPQLLLLDEPANGLDPAGIVQIRETLRGLAAAGKTVFVDVADIDWIEAAENYVQLHTGQTPRLLHVTMNTLEKSLDPGLFLRIHRSIIVNVTRVRELQPLMHGEYMLTLHNGVRLQSGRTYNEKLKSLAANPF